MNAQPLFPKRIRITLIFFFLLSSSTSLFSQSLEGEWQGHFNYEAIQAPLITYIALSIAKSNDSSYTIYSYTKLKMSNRLDTVAICAMNYEKLKDGRIKLQETRFLNLEADTSSFQTMYLRLKHKKGRSILIGYWESDDIFGRKQMNTGQIVFKKIIN